MKGEHSCRRSKYWTVALSEVDPEGLRERNIEAPKSQSRIDGHTIVVVGWVLGRSSPAVTVEVVHDGKILQRAPIDTQRLDIIDAFPGVPGAEHSGFRTDMAIPDLRESLSFLCRRYCRTRRSFCWAKFQHASDEIGQKRRTKAAANAGPNLRYKSALKHRGVSFGDCSAGEVVEWAQKRAWRSALHGVQILPM